MKQKYELHDVVWIHNGGEGNPLVKGAVVHIFEQYGQEHYIVEVPTSIDPLLEVRTAFEISEDEDGPIGLWRLRRSMK